MTPTEAAWSAACRDLALVPLSQVVKDTMLLCPVPWIRRAFAAPGARPCVAKGMYRLKIGDRPWPAIAMSVGRREPGKADRVAYALYTRMPDGTVDVLGRSKIDPARIIEPGKMPV